jgi:hypothetical protein
LNSAYDGNGGDGGVGDDDDGNYDSNGGTRKHFNTTSMPLGHLCNTLLCTVLLPLFSFPPLALIFVTTTSLPRAL